jgi:hypothetical protein
VQELQFCLRATEFRSDDVAFNFVTETLPPIRDTEWHGLNILASHSFERKEFNSKVPKGKHLMVLTAISQRYYAVHMWRITFVMGLFSLSSTLGLLNDPDVNSVDRLAFTFTLMLTATAYSLVIANSLPALGYLTLLDKYILLTFGFIALVSVQIAFGYWTLYEQTEDEAEPFFDVNHFSFWAALADFGLWLIVHFVLLAYIICRIIPSELVKAGDMNGGTSDAVEGKKKKNAEEIGSAGP